MWKCQIFLRLGGKNAAARVAVQAAVYGLSYCYGAFYTIVLFRQLVNAIQARASFESVLGLLAVFCAMGVANTLLKGWYEHRFVPRSDCALEQALAASVYQKAASADLACFEDSDYYDRMGRAWGAFIRTGSPDTDGLPWPAFTVERQNVMVLGDTCRVEIDPTQPCRAALGLL